MAVIGELEVKTVVNNKEAEKDLKDLRQKLKDTEKELNEMLKVKSDLKIIDDKSYEEAKQRIKDIKDELSWRTEQGGGYRKASIIIPLQNEQKELEKQISNYNEINKEVEELAQKHSAIQQQIENQEATIKRGEFAKVFKQNTKEIGKSIKQITRMGLAIFGIRGAYMMVRNAINVITQDDAQLKADIDYMKNAITYTLEPVVRWIVDLVKQIMYAVQNIAYFITGKNIFANASKHLSKAAGSAKQIRKQLAGFDEMNILSNSTGGGGSGATTPSMDLSKINKLSTQGQGIIGIILGIAGALSALKFSELLKNLGLVSSALSFTKALGIGFILTGLYYLIKDIKDIWDKFDTSIKDNGTTIKDWGKIVADVGIIIGGIALLIGAWPVAMAAAIALIIGLLMQNWDKIKKFFTEDVFGWMDKKMEELQKHWGGGILAGIINDSKNAIKEVLFVFDGMFRGIKQIFDGILKIFKGEFKDGFLSIGKGILNALISSINLMISGLNDISIPVRALIVGIGQATGKKWNMGNIRIPKIPYLAKGGIVNLPSRGVPIGNAIAGESGREGVIPLQDAQALNEIADAIGRRITINANITNNMDGRTISRQLQIIQNERDFVMNR